MSSIARMLTRLTIVLAVTLAMAVTHPVPSSAAGVIVTILESFDPDSVTVAPGTTITWVNESGNRHRVRSTSGPDEFDSGNLDPGQQFSITLSAVGTYAYRDDRDPDDSDFWAEIVVAKAAATATPKPPPGSAAPTPPPVDGDVGMAGKVFRPARISISAGGSVTWRNDDDRDHTVTATNDAFDSGTMAPGQSYKRTFPSAGTFAYLCVIHPDMTGTVVVTSPGGTPVPTAAPTPTPRPTPVTTPAPGTVRAIDYAFQPTSLDIAAGTRVTFINAGRAPHTVTARDGSFDSGTMPGGGSWARTFTTPGTFGFLCTLHPEMVGTIRVADASGGVPSPAPTAQPTPTPKPPPVTPPSAGSIRAIDYAFQPTTLTITAGTRVAFVNAGRAPHTMTARDGSFDSGMISAGGRWSRTFSVAGTFAYLCTLHPQMTGTVRVSDASGGVPPPAASPMPAASVSAPADRDAALSIVDFAFDPSTVRVAAGTTVTWVNDGVAPHTVTDRDGSFDSGFVASGASWSHTFGEPGTFAIWCVIHPEMTGSIEVTGEPAAGPSALQTARPDPTQATIAGVAGSNVAGPGENVVEDAAPEPHSIAGARERGLSEYAGIVLALALTGGAALLFMRTIGGAVRPPSLD